MLTRFLNLVGFVPIPWTDRYAVNLSGTIIDLLNGCVVEKVENKVIVSDGVRNHQLSVSVVVAIVFKNLRLLSDSWDKLDVLYVDGNSTNIHPENLVWRFNEPIEIIDGFFSIPGFTRYAINRKGQVYSTVVKRYLSPYTDEMGYWMYGVTPDVGKRTIVGMHRLLALTFLSYPATVDDCDVNHRDGHKANNDLQNLEWVSRKGNCDHAYSTGLRDDNIPVAVMNSCTGDITDYYSLEDCARGIGCDGETVRLRIRSHGQVIYPPGLQMKRRDDVTPWKIFDDPIAALFRSGVPSKIQVTDKVTGVETIYPSITKAAIALKLTNSGLSYRLRNSNMRYEDPAVLIQKTTQVC